MSQTRRRSCNTSPNDEEAPAPKYLRLQSDNDEDYAPNCAICYNSYSPQEKSILSPCQHEFCFSCIYQWLQAKQACPMCRTKPKQMSYTFQSTKKTVYTRPPPPLAAKSFGRLRLYVPMLQLFGKEDVLNSPELPEAFLNTVLEKCSLASDEHMFLIFYLIDSIELVTVEKGSHSVSKSASQLAHEFLISQLNLLDQILLSDTYDFVNYLLHNVHNRVVVEECNLIFHCNIGQFMPQKFAHKLWELLMAYLRNLSSQDASTQLQTPLFYFGLRHQRKDVEDEILFPPKSTSLDSFNSDNRLMQLMLSHFKAVISQNDDISKELTAFIKSNVKINGFCVCAFCDSEILLGFYNKYKIALLDRFLQLYYRGASSQNVFSITNNLADIFGVPIGMPLRAVPTTPHVKSLADEMSSVVNRLQHRQRLRSAQYQRNRARNFIQLVAAERQDSFEGVSSSTTTPVLPTMLVDKHVEAGNHSVILMSLSGEDASPESAKV